ncbi:MAG: hypothetical protein AVDCRST_MAG11-1809, partial [uncultured Gemmatimonadaceae bacterium]
DPPPRPAPPELPRAQPARPRRPRPRRLEHRLRRRHVLRRPRLRPVHHRGAAQGSHRHGRRSRRRGAVRAAGL